MVRQELPSIMAVFEERQEAQVKSAALLSKVKRDTHTMRETVYTESVRIIVNVKPAPSLSIFRCCQGPEFTPLCPGLPVYYEMLGDLCNFLTYHNELTMIFICTPGFYSFSNITPVLKLFQVFNIAI